MDVFLQIQIIRLMMFLQYAVTFISKMLFETYKYPETLQVHCVAFNNSPWKNPGKCVTLLLFLSVADTTSLTATYIFPTSQYMMLNV